MSSFDVYLGPFAHGETHEEKMDRWDEQDVRRAPTLDRFTEMPGVCDVCGRVEGPGEYFGGGLLDPFPPVCPECCDRQMMEEYEAQ